MAASPNLIPRVGLVVTGGFFAYAFLIVSRNGGPVTDMPPIGALLLAAMLAVTLATICIAAARAHRAGSWLWFAGVILLWPLAYLYTLAVNRRG